MDYAGINKLVGKCVSFDAEYYLRIRLTEEGLEIIENILGSMVGVVYDESANECDLDNGTAN